MLGSRILLIEDDMHVRRTVQDLLTRAGSQVSSAADGPGGLQLLYTERPDLVILDVNIRDSDGWETFQQIKRLTDTPVMVLASSSDNGAGGRAMTMGAADFIGKPFKPRSLLARTKNILERQLAGQGSVAAGGYHDHYLSFDIEAKRLTISGERIRLTKTELRILSYLVANAALLVTFEEILHEVWGPGYEGSIDYVHVYISRLRRKIEERPRQPRYIISEHGLGYRFNGAIQ